MKKTIEVELKIAHAWKRTAVFLKLVRHKTWNGALSGPYDRYAFAIIKNFRDEEVRLSSEGRVDHRGGDRKSKKYIEKPFVEKNRAMEKYIFDDSIRDIIRDIDSQEKKKLS